MLSKNLEEELNKQLNAELYSAYLYLSMSSFLALKNLAGFSNWMKIQFEEEQAHALKFYGYIIDRGGTINLKQIDAPPRKWNDVIDVFEAVLVHEQKITGLINNLIDLAFNEKDHATVSMLQWFIDEQVEEEAAVSEIIEQLKLIEGKGAGLFIIDRELKQRVFVPINDSNK